MLDDLLEIIADLFDWDSGSKKKKSCRNQKKSLNKKWYHFNR